MMDIQTFLLHIKLLICKRFSMNEKATEDRMSLLVKSCASSSHWLPSYIILCTRMQHLLGWKYYSSERKQSWVWVSNYVSSKKKVLWLNIFYKTITKVMNEWMWATQRGSLTANKCPDLTPLNRQRPTMNTVDHNRTSHWYRHGLTGMSVQSRAHHCQP